MWLLVVCCKFYHFISVFEAFINVRNKTTVSLSPPPPQVLFLQQHQIRPQSLRNSEIILIYYFRKIYRYIKWKIKIYNHSKYRILPICVSISYFLGRLSPNTPIQVKQQQTEAHHINIYIIHINIVTSMADRVCSTKTNWNNALAFRTYWMCTWLLIPQPPPLFWQTSTESQSKNFIFAIKHLTFHVE